MAEYWLLMDMGCEFLRAVAEKFAVGMSEEIISSFIVMPLKQSRNATLLQAGRRVIVVMGSP